MKRALLIVLVAALPLTALADYPRGPGLASNEDPKLSPLQVCDAMLAASRDGDIDGMIAHTSVYARQKIGTFHKLLLRLAHSRLASSRCIKVAEDHGDWVLIDLYAAGSPAQMPFLKEEGVWRFDQQRWEELRHQGKAPKP